MATSKRTVLITGCSPGGIGNALALEFQRQGCHVIATARNPAVLADLAAKGMSTLALDVTSATSIAACKAAVSELTGGKLDVLVNNAGLTHTIPALDIDIDDVRASFDANVFGPMAMCQAFSSLLIPARGLILQVSSLSAIMPYLFASVYASTKGALNSYSRVLRLELKPFGVRVMVAMTGTVRSNIMNHFDRTLPTNSLYQPVNDLFVQRLRFSQTRGTMDTGMYARRIVAQALKGEGWFGTPDWFWAGGFSNLAWVSTFMPTWLAEWLSGRFFKVHIWGRKVAAALAKKQA